MTIPLDLKSILSLRRPSRSIGQQILANSIEDFTNGIKDRHGNVWAFIQSADAFPTVMFTSHMDTVQRGEGQNTILHTGRFLYTNDILGADDGAGVYAMIEMFKVGVPGLYCWFVDEEIGRDGSEAWLKENSGLLMDVKICVSFDRAGDNEVIYNQLMSNTGSPEFAADLAKQIGLQYVPSSHGVFTDSYTFRANISECVNIGVGYENAHTSAEFLDVDHLERLINSLIAVRWNELETRRIPEDDEVQYGRFDGISCGHDYRDAIQNPYNSGYQSYSTEGSYREIEYDGFEEEVGATCESYEDSQLVDLIQDNPACALALLKKHYDSSHLIGLLAGSS